MTHLDLFTGIGGFSIAARKVWGDDHRIISFCEIDQRCRDFLSRAWPGVPCWDNIKTLDATKWKDKVDLLTGGPPCQPASRVGKQKGSADDRWLWPEAIRIVAECHPTWVLFENPPGIKDLAQYGVQPPVEEDGSACGNTGDLFSRRGRCLFEKILEEIEALGYEVSVLDIPAAAINAPHIRHRLWILAYATQERERPGSSCGNSRSGKFLEGSLPRANASYDAQSHLADCQCSGRDREAVSVCREESGQSFVESRLDPWSSYAWVPCADGKIRRAPDDSFGLVDGLHCSILGALGNSIVPQIAAEIMKAIKASCIECDLPTNHSNYLLEDE